MFYQHHQPIQSQPQHFTFSPTSNHDTQVHVHAAPGPVQHDPPRTFVRSYTGEYYSGLDQANWSPNTRSRQLYLSPQQYHGQHQSPELSPGHPANQSPYLQPPTSNFTQSDQNNQNGEEVSWTSPISKRQKNAVVQRMQLIGEKVVEGPLFNGPPTPEIYSYGAAKTPVDLTPSPKQ